MQRYVVVLTCLGALFFAPVMSAAFAKGARPHPLPASDKVRVWPFAHYRVEMLGSPSSLHGTQGLAIGPDEALYAASLTGHSIYRIDTRTGLASTFVGPPRGVSDDLAFSSDGTVYWTALTQGIVYARAKDGKVRTVAQDLPGVNGIGFNREGRLFVTCLLGADRLYELDPAGVQPPRTVAQNIGGLNAFAITAENILYGPIFAAGKIIRLDLSTGQMSDVATGLTYPSAVKIDADGALIALDYAKGDVFRIEPKSGNKTLIASLPPLVDNLAIARDGTIYVSSTAFNSIFAIEPSTLKQRRLTSALLAAPALLSVVDIDGKEQLLVADAWWPRLVDPSTGEASLIKAAKLPLRAAAIAANGSTYIMSVNSYDGTGPGGAVDVIERATGRQLAHFPNFGAPYDVKPVPDGFVVADFAVGRLTKVANDPAHTRTTFAWNFDGPVGLADAGDGQFYVSEYSGGRISRVDMKSNAQTVVIDGLKQPEGIALAPDGRLIVAEVGAQRVIAVDTGGGATVLADHLAIGLDIGSQTPTPFLPTGVAVGKDGMIYVTSDIDNVIYKLSAPSPK